MSDVPDFGNWLTDITSGKKVEVLRNNFTLVGTKLTSTNSDSVLYSIPTKAFDFKLGNIIECEDGHVYEVVGVVHTNANLVQEEHTRIQVAKIENNFQFIKLRRAENDAQERN